MLVPIFLIWTAVVVGQDAPPAPSSKLSLLDAVRYTLEHQPLIAEQQAQIMINRGLKLQAAAQFDTLLQSGFSQNHLNTPLSTFEASQMGVPNGSSEVSDLTAFSLSAGKLFRNGVSITPAFTMARDSTNSVNPVLNTTQLNFVVTVPLLRGRGRSAVAAAETAAATEVDASLLDLNQLMSQLIANSAASYWSLVAAQKMLAIAADAEQRGVVYVDNVKALIDADHVPRSDLNDVAANLADRSANRIAAEQEVVMARQQLAIDIGMRAYDLFHMLDPADDFPQGEDQPLPSVTPRSLEYYLDQALQHRADFLAAKRRIDKTGILRGAAKNSLLPQLNLNFESGYLGLDEGGTANHFFGSTVSGIPGPNAMAGVSYSFPPANSGARGQLMQADASVQQTKLQAVQLERTIGASVVTAIEGVRNAILRVKKARESVEYFRLSLDAQRERYREGISSVVDVLTVEDRLTNALSSQVLAQLSYALAMVQFRLATGTILAADRQTQTLKPQTLTTLPFETELRVNP